jgi:UDP-galactopyranose mutase
LELDGLKYLVVGAGFYGAVVAERIAEVLGKRVLVIDKRKHIGGNSYSEIDSRTGVEVHNYGSHIFHSKDVRVWEYLNLFCKFNNYRHRVLTKHLDEVYSMPMNLMTINKFYEKRFTPGEAKEFVESEIKKFHIDHPANFEEKGISLIGKPLYEAFIKGYSTKQWQKNLTELPESIINRLPVRYSYNDRYFSDPYEGIPIDGYGTLFENLLGHKNIETELGVDYFDIKDKIPKDCVVIYSGPIDRYFEYQYGQLGWRTLRFESEALDIDDFQGTTVMNYADESTPFTRIHEFKHYHPEREFNPKTTIFREFSQFAKKGEDPYYPIGSDSDKLTYQKYLAASKNEKNVIFGGRLGGYVYLDMDQVVTMALNHFKTKIQSF